jgi:hypothetical protein
MNTKTKLNGVFSNARDSLAKALDELSTAQSELGTLINTEAELQDALNGLVVKPSDANSVSRKTTLQNQIAEARHQSRAIETKRLPRAREGVAMALTACVEPYRDQLGMEIEVERNRFLKTARDYYREEAKAVEVAERSDKIAFLLSHLRIVWGHNCTDVSLANLVLARMDAAMKGAPLIEWPPPEPSPG